MPAARLVDPGGPAPRSWDGPLAALFPGDGRLEIAGGPWAVLGGPGTGKSALLVDLAAAHVAAGVPADAVLIAAPAKEAANRLREDLARRLPGAAAGGGGMVRAVHSLAFALVREAMVRRGEPEPRLMPGARQDAWIRDLLTGEEADGGAGWPDRLRPALGMRGFARQVRDLILRAQERGVDAAGLIALGEAHGVPEWTAVGGFLRRYRQAVRLLGSADLNAAELVSAALAEIDADPGLLDRLGVEVLLVDDAEHLDPQSAELLRRILARARVGVLTGDHDQSVLGFRGADPAFLDGAAPAERTIVLHRSRRLPAPVAIAANRLAARLPGNPPQRGVRGRAADPGADPALRVAVFATGTAERAAVADHLRRAHVVDGVAWGEMAVLLRSGAAESALHRSLARAGVPVQVDPTDVVLAEQRMVAALLLAMRALVEPLPESSWEALLTGPLGEADPVTLARVVRGVRRLAPGGRAMERIIALLAAPEPDEDDAALLAGLGARERAVLERPLRVLAAGRAALDQGVELVLWEMWAASGLADHLMARSLRGGAAGSAADRDLDAVMTLFDFAGDLVEQAPALTVAGFVAKVAEQELPTGARDRRGIARDAVSVISAHAALGREFAVVAVAGVQEETWPSLGVTGSVVRQQELVDLLDHGIDPGTPVSRVADRLDEERRLLHVAITRATRSVLVTAVDAPDDEGEPSRFLGELAVPEDAGADPAAAEAEPAAPAPEPPATIPAVPRVLAEGPLTAELRAAAADPGQGPGRRARAAAQLARLAAAGVPGAHPDQWWGIAERSTGEPVLAGPMRLSPSKVGRILRCPLRALLEPPARGPALATGTAFHRVAQALAEGVDPAEGEQELRAVLPRLLDEPGWRVDVLAEEWAAALRSWAGFAAGEAVGVEVPVRVPVTGEVTLAGRIDRLVGDADSGYVVVDIKTGANPPPAAEVEEDAQLAVYQLALAGGALVEGPRGPEIVAGEGLRPGGAMLVHPRAPRSGGEPTVRVQSAPTPAQLGLWRGRVLAAAEASRGPGATALPGPWCEGCPVRLACPTTGQLR